MNNNALKYIVEHPNENGFVLFVLGILFILSIYHFLLFFQHRDKAYLYYSLYTFLIFANHLDIAPNSFLLYLPKPFVELVGNLKLSIMWLYNIIYFIFVMAFAELKTESKLWYVNITRFSYTVMLAIMVVTIVAFYTWDGAILLWFNQLITPILLVAGLISYYPLFRLKAKLKYFVILGSFVLMVASITAFYWHMFSGVSKDSRANFFIFYIGVIIENIIFSLGLGYRQKSIVDDKNKSQRKLIQQLKENEQLRQTIHKQLKKEMVSYSKQTEQARISQLNTMYEKELVELKISSLRSQMNPHFIFNSLNSIKLYIIDSDVEKAVYYLNKFSKLIRKILASTREKEISLVEEIETTKLYLEIENIRFSNEIKTSFEIDGSLSLQTIKLPALILQPFIENAIWHGLSPKKGDKRISLSFDKIDQTYLVITISDNGIGRKKSAEIKKKKMHKRQSVGISLTEERLVNFYKDYNKECATKYIDLFDNGHPSGTKVVLTIPLS